MTARLGLKGVATLAVAMIAGAAHAQTKTGTTIGAFLTIEPSARIAAMGNAGVTVPQGLDAVYYNPAAISSVEHPGVYFAHSEWLADIAYNYAALGVPMGSFGNAFASVTSLGSGEIDVRTVDQPLGTGERFTVSDIAVGLGYGIEITDRFTVGGQVTFVQETIWHSSASTMTLEIGTLYQISDRGLRIGASLTHFGTDATFSGRDLRVTFDQDPSRSGDNGALPASQVTDPFALPVLFRVGLGLPISLGEAQVLTLAVDAAHPSDNTESVSAGAELLLARRYALRAGYQDAFQEDSEVGLTAGAGFQWGKERGNYRLDYGWADHGRLGNAHRIALEAHF